MDKYTETQLLQTLQSLDHKMDIIIDLLTKKAGHEQIKPVYRPEAGQDVEQIQTLTDDMRTKPMSVNRTEIIDDNEPELQIYRP